MRHKPNCAFSYLLFFSFVWCAGIIVSCQNLHLVRFSNVTNYRNFWMAEIFKCDRIILFGCWMWAVKTNDGIWKLKRLSFPRIWTNLLIQPFIYNSILNSVFRFSFFWKLFLLSLSFFFTSSEKKKLINSFSSWCYFRVCFEGWNWCCFSSQTGKVFLSPFSDLYITNIIFVFEIRKKNYLKWEAISFFKF